MGRRRGADKVGAPNGLEDCEAAARGAKKENEFDEAGMRLVPRWKRLPMLCVTGIADDDGAMLLAREEEA